MPPSLAARRDRCRDNANQTNFAATDANLYAIAAKNAMDEINSGIDSARTSARDARAPIQRMFSDATNAMNMITDISRNIINHAAGIRTETTEERAYLNTLVKSVEPFINQHIELARSMMAAATSAKSEAENAERESGYNDINISSAIQNNVTAAQSYAVESRKWANECKTTAYNRGDGGDDQRSNNERKSCEGARDKALIEKNIVTNLKLYTDPRKSNASYSLTRVNEKKIEVDNGLIKIQQIQSDLDAKTGDIYKLYNAITDYANDHSFTFLYNEIARIKPLQKTLETVTLPKDKKEEKDVKKKEEDLNTILTELKASLAKENAKGPLADQTSKELEDLEKELNLCTDKIDEYKKSLGFTNGRIGILSAQYLAEQTNLTNAETNKKTKFDEMILAEKKYIDLSGQLIKLQTDKSTLEGLLTSEELKYIELQKHIEILNKKIIELNIEDYSTKVYNNENLLQLNTTIDKDLKNIFSHLKTENINPDLLYTKTKYRAIEEAKLSNTNKLLDVLFYCFYFSFIIIRIVTRNTKTEDFLMYILIGLIPFVYPFIYKNSNYVIHLFHLDMNKNAFIETELESDPEISIDAYNI